MSRGRSKLRVAVLRASATVALQPLRSCILSFRCCSTLLIFAGCMIVVRPAYSLPLTTVYIIQHTMADVRSLLRNELASRKGSPSAGTRYTKKRKVDNDDDLMRKKQRPTAVKAERSALKPPSAQIITEQEEDLEVSEKAVTGPEPPSEPEEVEQRTTEDEAGSPTVSTAPVEASQPQTIDEDEWAAFEREVAAPTRVPHAPAAVAAPATISAAPISAEELAAQQQGANESAARSREAEVEGEREDAARFLEDEFDEMDQLEERVRRLKEKREELRKRRATENPEAHGRDDKPEPPPTADETEQPAPADDEESEDDDQDDDWDDWRFR